MKCPSCKDGVLKTKELEKNLPASECGNCYGIWIKATNYWNWLKKHGETLPEKAEEFTVSLPVDESIPVKICPDCGHFLTRRKVGHGLPFHVDRCGTCGGIWLDQNEWEVLKSRNLHDEIHYIFSEAWQDGILHDEQKKFYQDKARKILGEDDYRKIAEFKGWIQNHPQKSFVLAYIKDDKA